LIKLKLIRVGALTVHQSNALPPVPAVNLSKLINSIFVLQDGNNQKLYSYQKVTILAIMLRIIDQLVYFRVLQSC
jgi:hypothetical protein